MLTTLLAQRNLRTGESPLRWKHIPQACRCASRRALGFDGGDTNLYRYVFNRPTNLVDPTGLAPTTLKEAAQEFEKSPNTLAKIETAVEVANIIFAPAKIKIELVKFDYMDKVKYITIKEIVNGLNLLTTNQGRQYYLADLANKIAKKEYQADIGVFVVPDLTLFGIEANGVNVLDEKAGKVEKQGDISNFTPEALVGGTLLSAKKMTVLTLAQEIRDRLALQDVKGKGNKLRFGDTRDLIKDFGDLKLSSLCDDEIDKIRANLKKLGFIKEEPVKDKEYTIKIWVGYIPLGVKEEEKK